MIKELLIFDDTLQSTWIGRRDPRVKMIYIIFSLVAIIYANLTDLFILFFSAIIIAALTIKIRGVLNLIWNLKLFIFFIFIINFALSDWEFNLNQIGILLKFVTILIIFVILNRTTSPDQIVDSLIKLKIPPTLAWTIGASIRQSIFLIDDLTFIKDVQRSRMGYYKLNRKDRLVLIVKETYQMLISIYARALIIAVPYADTLSTRGWKKAHSTITLHTSKLDKNDLYFVLATILFPLILKLIMSSQIYI